MRSHLRISFLALLGLSLSGLVGCAGSFNKSGNSGDLRWKGGGTGNYYTVRKGDTIGSIASKHRTAVQAIAEWNNIQNPDSIVVGQKIYIPTVREKPGAKSSWNKSKDIATFHGKFDWPIKGPINSYFGLRGGRRHDGLDIGAKRGTPVHAAASGDVAFEGKLSGYGNLIILRHPGRYYTAYAHNSKHKVKKGQKIRKGQVISLVGTTGRTTGPHLHFEVRYGQQARNPLFFLQPNNATQRAIAKQAPKNETAANQRFTRYNSSGNNSRSKQSKVARGGKWRKYVPSHGAPPKVNKGFRRANR